MSGYKLIIGIAVIILAFFMWVPLNYVMGLTGTALNAISSDPGVIQRNNVVVSAYYFTLFIIVLAIVIYIIKPDKGETEPGEVVYV